MEKDAQIMHKFAEKEKDSIFTGKYLFLLLIIALIGLGTGFVFTKILPAGLQTSALPAPEEKNQIVKGKIFGSNDTNTFKDTTEGELKEGGVDGEGQYHLVRPGGESQNVYITSTIVDLSLFLNRKIKIWGQTQKAQKAGWLMDVGRVEVLN